MRFGLLAADDDAMRLVAAAAESAKHQFTVAFESDGYSAALTRHGVAVRDGTWQNLLHAPECEAVVVGRGGDEETRADQLRKLVQAAVPLVVVHPTGDMLLSFELQMIQQDTGSPIVPYFPGLENPHLRSWGPFTENVDDDDELQQLLFEREISTVAPEAVIDQFSRDALLIRRWVGRIDRVGALGSKPYPSDDWGNLSVHMTSREGIIARWSASPITTAKDPQTADGEATAVSSKAKSRISIPLGVDLWKDEAGEAIEPNDTWALDAIRHAVNDSKGVGPREEGSHYGPGRIAADEVWEDACRAIELADTLHPSYRRGKTIELYHEKHTEEETFKGMMAAGGCLAIMFVIFLLPALVAVDALNLPFFKGDQWRTWPWKALHYRAWPFYLLGALAVFLSMQFLRLVFHRNSSDSESQTPVTGD